MRQLGGMVNVRGRNRTLTRSTPLLRRGVETSLSGLTLDRRGCESARLSSFALASQQQ
jgi:hypothetical protein